LPKVPGTHYQLKPLFLLTSQKTFSAAEGFAYGLQSTKRATIVGERTAGGAYGGGRQGINEHFDLLLSTSRSVSAVTHTDWQGTGVRPDVPVPAAQALDVAIARARR
jgi:C-terminal processing protease CtpA/Prc